MKFKRILCAFLASLMVVGTMAACATADEEQPEDSKSTEAATEGETVLRDNLPGNLDYSGAEITIISRDMEGWTRGEVSVDGLNGDPVNDAVYERNKSVESRLNIKFNSILEKTTGSGDVPNKVVTSVQAGTGEYDLMAAAAYTTFNHTISGNFANLKNLEFLDLEQPWWTQGFNEAASYHGSQFAITGVMVLSTYRRTYSTVFNKQLFDDANQPYLYEYVENGTWTLDKQISLVPLFHRDNGNNQQDKEGDIYGFVSDTYISIDPYQTTAELEILRKNKDGDYEWAFNNERISDLTDKVLELYYGTDGGMYVVPDPSDFQESTRTIFSNNYAAMATLCLQALEHPTMRNMTSEYGVVPIPKFDQTITTYHSAMHDGYTVAVIPTTVTGDRLDQMSAVLEAMGSASYRIIQPAYYELTLRTKIAQDPQSAEMMDLLTKSIVIDPGIIYSNNMGGFHAQHRDVIAGKKNNSASRYKSLAKSAQKNLTRITEKLDKLVEQA